MLSNKQYRLLRQAKSGIIRDRVSNPDLEYLYRKGLVAVISYADPRDPYFEAHITEEGEAEFDSELRTRLRIWVPVAIADALSLAALIISLVS